VTEAHKKHSIFIFFWIWTEQYRNGEGRRLVMQLCTR